MMRRIGHWAAAFVLAAAVSAGLASAQGLDGPLAAPDAPMPSAPQPVAPKRVAPKRVKTRSVARRSEAPVSAKLPPSPVSETPRQASAPASKTPEDPISFGMKWSGSNESGRETRFENLGGGAQGTGGEVGLKLHF